MHFSKQQHEHEDSETVYKQAPTTPSAPDMRSSEGDVSKHDLPVAIAVPIDSPSSYQRSPPLPSSVRINYDGDKRHHWLVRRALRVPSLLAFHVLNFILAVAAFSVVVTLFSLSVGLIPLCCFGVLVFQLLAAITQYTVVLDVALANMVTPVNKEKLRVHERITSGFTAQDCNGIVSRLTFVAPRTIGAMVYLMTIKFVVGIVSCTVAALVLGGPVAAIVLASGYPDYQYVGITYADHPVWYVLSAIGTLLLGFVLLPAVASLSWRFTNVLCAEKTQRE
ncbi:hypothetical protein Gpo141_00005316 [Globisporangium polare]